MQLKNFPMFLCIANRAVVIVGGGEQAAQKCRLMLKTEARIIVAWHCLCPELENLVHKGRVIWHKASISPVLFENAALVFIATECPASSIAIHALAKGSGAVINVVDQPELCTGLTPSLVDRDPVVVAIGTEGDAPVMAQKIKSQIEVLLEPGLGALVKFAGSIRCNVARHIPLEERRIFWNWVFDKAPRFMNGSGNAKKAIAAIKEALTNGGVPVEKAQSVVSLIGAASGPSDLLTLRAARKLREADLIIHDKSTTPGILELARRDAQRIVRDPADETVRYENGNFYHSAIKAAEQGKSVVILKEDNPLMLENCKEELQAVGGGDILVEIIPVISTPETSLSQKQKSEKAGNFSTIRKTSPKVPCQHSPETELLQPEGPCREDIPQPEHLPEFLKYQGELKPAGLLQGQG